MREVGAESCGEWLWSRWTGAIDPSVTGDRDGGTRGKDQESSRDASTTAPGSAGSGQAQVTGGALGPLPGRTATEWNGLVKGVVARVRSTRVWTGAKAKNSEPMIWRVNS